MPASFQELRDLVTKIRADFVANMVKEGQFTSLDNGITFHYRERSGDALLGIFMQDRRDKGKKRSSTSPSAGRPSRPNGQSLSRAREGQRSPQAAEQPRFVDRRLRALCGRPVGLQPGRTAMSSTSRASARTTQLLFPDQKEGYYQIQEGRFRAELHDRLVGLALSAGDDDDRLRRTRRRAHHPPGPRHRDRGRRVGGRGPAHRRLRRVERGGALAIRRRRHLWGAAGRRSWSPRS